MFALRLDDCQNLDAGEIHNALNQAFVTTYDGLRDLVDLMFPFVMPSNECSDSDFSTHNYWKLPSLAPAPSPAPKS
jgi:phosphatidate phosphatase PAH1